MRGAAQAAAVELEQEQREREQRHDREPHEREPAGVTNMSAMSGAQKAGTHILDMMPRFAPELA